MGERSKNASLGIAQSKLMDENMLATFIAYIPQHYISSYSYHYNIYIPQLLAIC